MKPEEQRIYDAGYTAGYMDCSKKLHEQSTEQKPVTKEKATKGRESQCGSDSHLSPSLVGVDVIDSTTQKQEPVAKDWRKEPWGFGEKRIVTVQEDTSPPQEATRKPLTDEEIRQKDHYMVEGAYHNSFKQGVRWAEYKHGIGEKE